MTTRTVAALAGGVGGAKLLVGLQPLLGRSLSAIVNTGDDDTMYGVHVSPDVDIVTYWLAGIADTERGWGLRDDTFEVVDALGRMGVGNWFRLGDRDLATCILRTERLAAGASLGEVTREVATRLGVEASVLPMTDDRVRTQIVTSSGERLDFQEYFVGRRADVSVSEIIYSGIDSARPAPGVIEALTGADVVILCPSNPLLSLAPILGLDGVRETLRAHERVVGISPLVGGRALKGPADRLMRDLGLEPSASGVAALYSDFCTDFVIDRRDQSEADKVAALGMDVIVEDTILDDQGAAQRLAAALLES